jgi:hypothetical protein
MLMVWYSSDTNHGHYTTVSDASHNAIWPIYDSEFQDILLPSTLDKSLFGRITLFDPIEGPTQMIYKGWPLYYFGSDNTRGNTKGVSTPAPGIWPVAVRDLPSPPATVGLGNWDY